MDYSRLMLDNIERERTGTDYRYPDSDRAILREMFDDIKNSTGVSVHYLAEMDAYNIEGAGNIIAKYITMFSSESVKGYLIPQIVAAKVKDCDRLLLQLYLHFKDSNEYISKPHLPAPAHIYTRYDNAFKTLKPKKLKIDLTKLAYSPRDAFYLPFTMRMLASWRIPELEDVFISYLDETIITAQSIGLCENVKDYFPSLAFVRSEIRLLAVDALKYYPSSKVMLLIEKLATDPNPNIQAIAKKTMKYLSSSTK